MTLEELRFMKRNLEGNVRYVIVSDLINWKCDQPRTLSDVLGQVDTKKMVKKCEEALESLTKYLISRKIQFDQIKICTNPGIICSEPWYQESNRIIHESINPNYGQQAETLAANVLPEIIPVRFFVDITDTGIYNMNGESEGINIAPNELVPFCFEGLVHYSEFVKAMKNLGYKVRTIDGSDLSTFDDYVSSLKNSFEDTLLTITLDFGREAKMNAQKVN